MWSVCRGVEGEGHVGRPLVWGQWVSHETQSIALRSGMPLPPTRAFKGSRLPMLPIPEPHSPTQTSPCEIA